tara:strand:- start:2278 stop:2577 length:300 start_codon:yes stop_codon:yes gene_type:complete
MQNNLLKKIVTILERFDKGLNEGSSGFGIDKPALRDAKVIIAADDETTFIYDLTHNDGAEIEGKFSLYHKKDGILTPVPLPEIKTEKIKGIDTSKILYN